MARVRSTEHFTYSTDDCLGLGATCEVFKGISKKGEIRALKVFGPRADTDLVRELKALRTLNHPNIIKYYGVEEEIGTRRQVVITEYCDGGSLLDYLNRPENAYGLDEEEFILFLKHILAGMKHYREQGFVHRDIKPANVLRCINEDGRSLYKLSDFGTAKPLDNDEHFQSLVGTEEYLHPDIYKAAFFERHQDRQFSHTVDLWSLGATLYHSATGKVPFRPHHGRADKATMFQMIAKKPAGVIAGVQTAHGAEIKWYDSLPDTSPLSPYLKTRISQMILQLMETKMEKLWTFEDFFQEAEDILDKEVLTVLSLTSVVNPFTKLFLDSNQSISVIEVEIQRQTKVTIQDQQLILEDAMLYDLVKKTEKVKHFPLTNQEEPVILIPRSQQRRAEIDPVLKEIRGTSTKFVQGSLNLDLDYKHAKRLLEQVGFILRQCRLTSLSQRIMVGVIRRLRRRQIDRESNVRAKQAFVAKLFTNVNDLANSINSRNVTSMWPQGLAHLITTINDETKSLEESLQQKPEEDFNVDNIVWCCENSLCQNKFARWFERAKDIVPHFYQRKKSNKITRLTERTSTIEKAELTNIHKLATDHWEKHCTGKMGFLQTNLFKWATKFYEWEGRLQSAEETLAKIEEGIADISRQLADSQKSCVGTSMKSSEGVRQKSLSIDRGVKDELKRTKEMKAIVVDFNKKYCEIFEDLEPLENFELPEDLTRPPSK